MKLEIAPNRSASPRLLTTAVLDQSEAAPPDARQASHARLSRGGWLIGNGRAIFVGLAIAAAVLYVAGHFASRDGRDELAGFRRFFAVRTRAIVPAPLSSSALPIAVQIRPELLRVSAIALGHPRLAVINGIEVAEGDWVVVRVPNGSIEVKLQVTKISDGNVTLTDGSQIITARLPKTAGR